MKKMVLIVGISKARYRVGQPVLRGQTRRKLSTRSTRPMRILEETARLEIKANVKLKGQAQIKILESQEKIWLKCRAKWGSKTNSHGWHGGYILKDKKICTQGE